jgi:hypothetical protein
MMRLRTLLAILVISLGMDCVAQTTAATQYVPVCTGIGTPKVTCTYITLAQFAALLPPGPPGPAGAPGSPGQAATIAAGNVVTLPPGSPVTVINSGSTSAAVFDFGIPQGNGGTNGTNGTNGVDGAAATITVGTVTIGTPASVTNVGTSAAAIFNFVLQPGPPGPQIPGLTVSTDGTTLIWNGIFQTTATGPGSIQMDGFALTCTATGPKCQ